MRFKDYFIDLICFRKTKICIRAGFMCLKQRFMDIKEGFVMLDSSLHKISKSGSSMEACIQRSIRIYVLLRVFQLVLVVIIYFHCCQHGMQPLLLYDISSMVIVSNPEKEASWMGRKIVPLFRFLPVRSRCQLIIPQ